MRVAAGLGAGLDDQVRVLRAVVETVVGAADDAHVREGGRVQVVADPAGAGDVEVVGVGAGVEEGVPLLVDEGDVDAQVVLPLLLHALGDLLVAVAGVVEDRRSGSPCRPGNRLRREASWPLRRCNRGPWPG